MAKQIISLSYAYNITIQFMSISIMHVQAQAEGVYTRLHSTHGDDPPTGEEFAKEVDFQVQQARKIQALYNSLGHSSQYVSWELEDELGR